MKTRQELKEQLINNRLMQNYEATELFEEAMNELYKEDNLENITYYCEAFDDNTEHHEVMFGMIHGIEAYDEIFGKEKSLNALLKSLFLFNSNAYEWVETIFIRIINSEEHMNILLNKLKELDIPQKAFLRIIFDRIKKEILKSLKIKFTN